MIDIDIGKGLVFHIFNYLIDSNFFKRIVTGSTRTVFLTDKYAYKFAYSFNKNSVHSSWRKLLNGLICNLQEKYIYGEYKHTNIFCPVDYSIIGGLIIRMPRAEKLNENIDFFAISQGLKHFGMHDIKPENMGMLNGSIVVIDYADYAF